MGWTCSNDQHRFSNRQAALGLFIHVFLLFCLICTLTYRCLYICSYAIYCNVSHVKSLNFHIPLLPLCVLVQILNCSYIFCGQFIFELRVKVLELWPTKFYLDFRQFLLKLIFDRFNYIEHHSIFVLLFVLFHA